MPSTDQWFFDPQKEATGSTFSRDGSDYDPSVSKPSLAKAYNELSRVFDKKTHFQVVVTGILYKGSSDISGAQLASVSLATIETVSTNKFTGGKSARNVKTGRFFSLEEKIRYLFGWNDPPERITGLYFRALD